MSEAKRCADHEFVQHKRINSACAICYRRYSASKSRQYRVEAANLFNEYKVKTGCAKCGYNGHFAGLEFDHIVAVKGGLKRSGIKRTKASLAKLIQDDNIQVLCATCHRIKTWENGDYKKDTETA
jgi:5-methylcytosine-specific restriction endonuclease McrA